MVYTHPDVVRNVHLGYLRAGADIIETNTYQASVAGMCKQFGVSSEKAVEIIASAAVLAKDVAENFHKTRKTDAAKSELPRDAVKPALVAGAVGPYGACLCDRSEYHGNYVDAMTEEQLIDWHRPRVEALLKGGVDVLAFETIPAQKEADALVKLLREFPSARAWMSFSCKDDGERTAHGELLRDAAVRAASCDQIVLVGVNCVAPSAVAPLLRCLGQVSAKRLIAYPDGCANEQLAALPALVGSWLELGAAVVGGCCGVSAPHIELVRSVVDAFQSDKSGVAVGGE